MNPGQYYFSDRFFNYFNYLRTVGRDITSRTLKTLDNKKLRASASQVNVPYPFKPYMKYIENTTGKPFPQDLAFTADDVNAEDLSIIEAFSQDYLNLKGINLNYLFKAALIAASELGIVDSPFKMRQLTLSESIDSFQGNTSASYPLFKKKYTEEAREDALTWAGSQLKSFKFWELMVQPCAVFHRFQYKVKQSDSSNSYSIKKKIRPVWGVPFRVLALEGFVFRGLVERYTLHNLSAAEPICSTGRTKLQISNDIISRLRSYNKPIVSVDYKRFDSTVHPLFWALFYSLTFETLNVGSKFSEELFKGLMAYGCFTPFCWKSTTVKYQRRGVPSGSLLTSMFDTFVNRTLVNYASLEYTKGRTTISGSSCVLGDDLVFCEDGLTLSHIVNVAKRFGMNIVKDDCTVSSPTAVFDFLGYFWDSENRPTQVIEWYIAHLCLPSRFISPDTYGLPISILQTYRGICVCMGLYKGMETFEFLVGNQDYEYQKLKDLYQRGSDPIIQYVGEDMRLFKIRIPMSVIFKEGWKSL